jgi:hypothetical protein
MYNSGPDVDDCLDLDILRKWLDTVYMNRIASFGIYGGEPSIALDEYQKILNMVKVYNKPQFVITNGSWSTSEEKTKEFYEFCRDNKLHVVVSGTPEHRKFQNRKMLEMMKEFWPDAIRLKPEDENYHPMGRLAGKFPVSCGRKCMTWNRALRITIQPDGSIIFMNCQGVYPVVGNIKEDFSKTDIRIKYLRAYGFDSVCPHYNSQVESVVGND